LSEQDGINCFEELQHPHPQLQKQGGGGAEEEGNNSKGQIVLT
jgi:hypothetical protein